MGNALITRRGGGSSEIENSVTKTMRALKNINANSFVEEKLSGSFVSSSITGLRHKFFGTEYYLVEPRQRDGYYGLASSTSASTSTTCDIKVLHPDGTLVTVASIPEKVSAKYGGFLNQVLPVSDHEFIAVYSWGTLTGTPYKGSYDATSDKRIGFVLYELDETMSTAVVSVELTTLNRYAVAVATGASGYKYNPYGGFAVTAVLPTKFEKCFALVVFQVYTYSGSTSAMQSAPYYTSTLIYIDCSKSPVKQTEYSLGYVQLFTCLNYPDVVNTYSNSSKLSVSLNMKHIDIDDEGVYETVSFKYFKMSNDSSDTLATGVYFIRIKLSTTEKVAVVFTPTFIEAISPNSDVINGYHRTKKVKNSDGTETSIYVSIPKSIIPESGPGNEDTLKAIITTDSEGEVSDIAVSHIPMILPMQGKTYDGQNFSIKNTANSSGYCTFKGLGVINNTLIGSWYGSTGSYFSISINGIIPISYASLKENPEEISFTLTGLPDSSPTALNYACRYGNESYDYSENIMSLEGTIKIMQYQGGTDTSYYRSFKDLILGVITSMKEIIGVSKESALQGEDIDILVLKEE